MPCLAGKLSDHFMITPYSSPYLSLIDLFGVRSTDLVEVTRLISVSVQWIVKYNVVEVHSQREAACNIFMTSRITYTAVF